jgi:hypothetical protein
MKRMLTFPDRHPTSDVWRRTTILTFEQLRRDSDGDGLTDLTEWQLFTLPHDPDSDGDGLEDSIDACPTASLADSTQMTRGIERAMAFHFGQYAGEAYDIWRVDHQSADEVIEAGSGLDPVALKRLLHENFLHSYGGQHWQARYYNVHGADGPVGFAAGSACYGIKLDNLFDIDRYQTFYLHDPYQEPNPLFSVYWNGVMDPADEYHYSVIPVWFGSANHPQLSSVTLTFGHATFDIALRELGGELYPVGYSGGYYFSPVFPNRPLLNLR